jgi:hypothetical protein
MACEAMFATIILMNIGGNCPKLLGLTLEVERATNYKITMGI